MDRDEIRQELIDARLDRIADAVVDGCRPCIAIATAPGDDADIPLGSSKFGGSPDVPSDFSWPTWKDQPLSFLAQVNLPTLAKNPAAAPLPSSGLLTFFYDREQSTWGFDPSDRGSWRVFMFSNVDLIRTPAPDSDDHADYSACEVAFQDKLSVPDLESRLLESLDLSEEEVDKFIDFMDEIDLEWRAHHQLLGHPRHVQGEMQLECQLVSHGIYCGDGDGHLTPRAKELESGAADWVLLFQCDTDEHADWMWGDAGMLYFWITRSDLEARRFENVWMVLQCG